MDKFNHMIWAAIFFIIVFIILNEIMYIQGPDIFVAILITLLYSLIPDLDLKSSWIKNQFNRIVAYFLIMLIILFFATGYFNIVVIGAGLLLIEIFLQLIKHRTILHSPIFGFFMCIPLLFINYPNFLYLIAGFIGYYSHLFLDRIKK